MKESEIVLNGVYADAKGNQRKVTAIPNQWEVRVHWLNGRYKGQEYRIFKSNFARWAKERVS